MRVPRPIRPVLLALIAAVLGGCFNPFNPPQQGVGTSEPPPEAASPQGVLERLEWAYKNRDVGIYRELFTDDYRFAFSALDTNGNAYRGDTWRREDELTSTTNLFQGGHATEPAATDIRLEFDRNLFAFPDPRPGKDPGWHQNIRTTVALNITTTDGNVTTVQGRANFYVVREDSAKIPVELRERGFGLGKTLWFIERWEDETDPPLGAQAGAAPTVSPTAAPGPRGPAGFRLAPSARTTPGYTVTSWGGVKRRWSEPRP